MSKNQVSSLLVGSLIVSLLGTLLLLVGSFGGVYYRKFWYRADWGPVYIDAYEYVGFSSSWWSALITGVLALGLFYCSYVSIVGLRSPDRLSYNNLRRGFLLSLVVAVGTLLVGLALIGYATVMEYEEWWLDTAFYAGLIGGGLSALFFKLSLDQVSRA